MAGLLSTGHNLSSLYLESTSFENQVLDTFNLVEFDVFVAEFCKQAKP